MFKRLSHLRNSQPYNLLDYRVVIWNMHIFSSDIKDINTFEAEIKKLANKGYVPHFGLTKIDDLRLVQVMVKKKLLEE